MKNCLRLYRNLEKINHVFFKHIKRSVNFIQIVLVYILSSPLFNKETTVVPLVFVNGNALLKLRQNANIPWLLTLVIYREKGKSRIYNIYWKLCYEDTIWPRCQKDPWTRHYIAIRIFKTSGVPVSHPLKNPLQKLFRPRQISEDLEKGKTLPGMIK